MIENFILGFVVGFGFLILTERFFKYRIKEDN